MVLHFGAVMVGGVVSMGEESLLGREVNFVFRVEKVAGALGAPSLVSDAARDQLQAHLATEPAGTHAVPSFEGTHALFTPRF